MSTLNELMKYGIDTLAYLIPRNERITTSEFAALIRKQIDNPRAEQIAAEFDKSPGILDRRWNGTRFEAESAETKHEIAARSAGLRLVTHPQYERDSGFFAIMRKEGGEGSVLPGVFKSMSAAWTAAYQSLGAPFELRRVSDYKVDSAYPSRSHAKDALDEIDRSNPLTFYGIDIASGGRFLSFAGVTALQKDRKSEQEFFAALDRDKTVQASAGVEYTAQHFAAKEAVDGVSYTPDGYPYVAGENNRQHVSVGDLIVKGEQGKFSVVKGRALHLNADIKPAPAPETGERVTYYGTIAADHNDRTILEGLGIVIGHGNETSRDGGNEFTVMVSEQAMRELDPYWGSFVWQLSPLEHSIKPDDAALKKVSFKDMSDEQLQAYDAYLTFKLDQNGKTSDSPVADGVNDLVCEMAALKRERDRRLVPDHDLRAVQTPTHSIEI